jgi:uncharacterized protein
MTSIKRDQDDDVVRSDGGRGDTFQEVFARRLSRRDFLKAAAGAALVVGAERLAGGASAQAAEPQQQGQRLAFGAIQPDTQDRTLVADGYGVQVLLRWGDPIMPGAPEFDVNGQTAAAQAMQFGYNCDFIGYFPVPAGTLSNTGILVVNHEYTNPELMFAGYNTEVTPPTQEQVDIEIAAHGLSVVLVSNQGGGWSYDRNASINRRITMQTPFRVSGPAAGLEWMRTNEDPGGTVALGTLNNCAGGKTPWGTVLSGEENFHQYFANLGALAADDPRVAVHARYGIPEASSERGWELYHDRFDLAKEPNEAFRFGWVIEFDPYDPGYMPTKRTALGRFRHEGATFATTPSGRVAFYTGDDAVFEYVYKFVTNRAWNPGDKAANRDLLDDGVLYVARFNDDGSGEWLPLVFGQGPLTEANGFSSQGDVLIKTRLAADLLGATKMDRPEDIETNPVTNNTYIVLTNNSQRGTEGRPGADSANPRAENRTGHIIELRPGNGDHAASTFSWEMFLLAGDPANPATYFAGFDKSQVSIIASPDNVTFDSAGNLWISTDGQPSAIKLNDGLYGVPVEGSERGYLRQFFSTPIGAECSGPEFTPDNSGLFISVQHPGEGGTFEAPTSTWPDGTMPRPSVVVVTRNGGGPIGVAAQAAPEAPAAELSALKVTAAALGRFVRRE